MATTITLQSSKYDGRYLELVCEQTSKNSADNKSTIKWTLYSKGGNETWYSTGPTKVVINGTTVYSKSRVDWDDKVFPASTGSTSGTTTVTHTTDGSKSIKVSLSTAIYYGESSVATVDKTWELDPVPRYATVTHSLAQKTETSIKMNWSSDSTIDYIWYSKDNGSNWTGVNVTDGKSGTYTISSLSANTTYKIKTRVRRKDSQLTTDSSALSVTTYNFPYCTESPNFVLGNQVTLKFYNPLSRAFKFYIIGNGTQIEAEYNCSSTTYTGVNGATTSIPYLYATIPNAQSGKYKVKVVYDGHTNTRDNGNTYSINKDNCYPTFTNFTYKDTNTKVTNVTGNNQVFVNGLSTLQVTIPVANKMTTKNSATAKNYVASIDKLSKTINYSNTANVSGDVGTIASATTKRLYVKAVDSRELSKTVYKDITIYDYSKPTIKATVERKNNFEAQSTLKVSGNFTKLVIGGAEKNTITKTRYRFREINGNTVGEWTEAIDLTTTVNQEKGTFTCEDVVIDLDNTKAFEFDIRAYDTMTESFTSYSKVTVKVDVGEAIFFISTNKRKCYVLSEEVATINTAYPVGSVYCRNANINPTDLFGGTWELIDKGFKSGMTSNTDVFTPYDNTITIQDVFAVRGNNTLHVRLRIKVGVELTDYGQQLGTFNWDKLGVTEVPLSRLEHLSFADGANCGIVWNVGQSGGVLEQLDVFNKTSISTNATFTIDMPVTVRYTQMLDSFCDKFYFQRTK